MHLRTHVINAIATAPGDTNEVIKYLTEPPDTVPYQDD
jgi:hypothetical protein